ncbi:MAG: M23 family metallopeptidase [Prevotellaceae bacterium]|jgi:murein DD-endopeptidase MepM/ murein hydrolase activator NlpD|nr:M23 family metallopeptidase [Prevotellaceae bacterium]
MAKHSYKFNPESLSYVKVKKNWFRIALRLFSYFLASVMLAIVYYLLFSPIYHNPEERKLLRQYRALDQHYDSLLIKYELVEDVIIGIQERDSGIYRSVFFSDPISPFGKDYNLSGDDRLDRLNSYSNKELVHTTYQQIDKLVELSNSNKQKFETIRQMLSDSSSNLTASIPAIQPVENSQRTRVGASVGMKIHPFYKMLRMHEGIDYTVPIGTEVYATGDGVITSVETAPRGEGTSITVDHGFGYTTKYAHLSKVLVRKGTKVRRGEIIALSGDSGASIWPHLHYEVRKNGKFHNPVNYFFGELSPEELEIIINLSSNTGQSLD